MKKIKLIILSFLVIFCLDLSGCSDESNEAMDKPEGQKEGDLLNTDYNILFIGNSLTYSNYLPGLVKSRAQQSEISIGTKMIAVGNYALIDHWNDGKIQEEIATELYDFVVVQQGPSSQSFGRQVLIEYGKKIKDVCDENNAELVYYMVWPSRTYYHTFAGVIKNHEDAATINKAMLCPVGKIWKQHFDATGNFDYYGVDGFHPSLKGSEVAAEIIFTTLFE